TFFKIVGVVVEPLALLIDVTIFAGGIDVGVPILSPLLSTSVALYQLRPYRFTVTFLNQFLSAILNYIRLDA
ncbi:hypothetical protein, partial [Acinetobacter sp. ANC 4641]